MNDVLEFRRMIEVEVATLAAQKITDREIEILTECYEKMFSDISEVEKAKYDKMFHGTIVKAAKNQIILNAYNAMSPMLQIFTLDIRSQVVNNEHEGILEEIHRDIYEAIAERNVEKARISMQIHMETIIKNY
jgi:GntR family transcriptional repressor for pyruvate dehydrogenase complex